MHNVRSGQVGPVGASRRIVIVTTRSSGNRRGYNRARRLNEALRSRGYQLTLETFSDLDSLRSWAQRTATPCSLLICVGGDGTLNAAVAAAMRHSVPFLPVPSGFGNLFAGALGQPRRLEQVVELVENGALLRVDVGRCNGEFFLCQQSFGLLQQIQDRTEAGIDGSEARWQRSLAYYRTALHNNVLQHADLPRLTVSVNGRVMVRDAVVVTVSNVETYGAWLKLTPGASPIDGLFDVFAMTGRNKRDVLLRLLRRHFRLASGNDDTFVWRGRRVSVAAPQCPPDQLALLPHRLLVVVTPKTAAALGCEPVETDRFWPLRSRVAA